MVSNGDCMKKRNSVTEGWFGILLELAGMFWQVGAFITIVLAFFSIQSLFWVASLSDTQNYSAIVVAVSNSFAWILYLLPLSLAILAFIIGKKTYQTYIER